MEKLIQDTKALSHRESRGPCDLDDLSEEEEASFKDAPGDTRQPSGSLTYAWYISKGTLSSGHKNVKLALANTPTSHLDKCEE